METCAMENHVVKCLIDRATLVLLARCKQTWERKRLSIIICLVSLNLTRL